ncbi:unnamed protein product [Prunus armeniaca]
MNYQRVFYLEAGMMETWSSLPPNSQHLRNARLDFDVLCPSMAPEAEKEPKGPQRQGEAAVRLEEKKNSRWKTSKDAFNIHQDDYNHHEIKSYAPKCSSAQTLSGCAQHPIHKHSVRMAYHDGLTITKPKLVCGAIKRRRETPGILRASLTALA